MAKITATQKKLVKSGKWKPVQKEPATVAVSCNVIRPGTKVDAPNYRRGGAYENGTIMDTEITVKKDGTLHVSYRVMLDRRSNKDNYLFIYVGPEGLYTIE